MNEGLTWGGMTPHHVAEDPLSPRPPPVNFAERLSQTGAKISELSKKAAAATKQAVGKVADASKDAVSKTNEAVTQRAEAKREKKEEKLTQKIEETKAELKDDGFIDIAPAMITLPEFEEERMALMGEEHDILVDLVDHMHALSQRVDQLEHTYRALAIEETKGLQVPETNANSSTNNAPVTGQGMTSALSLLGASLVWVVLLTGIDRYISSEGLMIFTSYPAEIPVWGIGAGTWLMFVIHKLGNAAPFLRVSTPMLVQTGLAVSITTMMALLLTDDTISTMSGVWTWGTAIAVAVLVSSSLIASAWRNTKEILSPNETVELID
jgi:multisubunit Na+/H+ antiporter MnhE subunit